MKTNLKIFVFEIWPKPRIKAYIFLFLLIVLKSLGQSVSISGGASLTGQVAVGTDYPILTNSFQLRMHNEVTNASGTGVTPALLTNATVSMTQLGTWSVSSAAVSNIFFTSDAEMRFTNLFNFGNYRQQIPAGNRGLAFALHQSAAADEQKITLTFSPQLNIVSFGFPYVCNITNDPANVGWDLFVVNTQGQNSGVLQWNNQSPGGFLAHSVSNSISYGGTKYPITIGSTNWITCLYDMPNGIWKVSLYSASSASGVFVIGDLIGESTSVVSFSETVYQMNISTYGHGFFQPKTNYLDNLIINTSGTYPLLPTTF